MNNPFLQVHTVLLKQLPQQHSSSMVHVVDPVQVPLMTNSGVVELGAILGVGLGVELGVGSGGGSAVGLGVRLGVGLGAGSGVELGVGLRGRSRDGL